MNSKYTRVYMSSKVTSGEDKSIAGKESKRKKGCIQKNQHIDRNDNFRYCLDDTSCIRGKTKTKDLCRLIHDNHKLKMTNYSIRANLSHVRRSTFVQCARVLSSIMAYCDAKAKCAATRLYVCGEGQPNRAGAGCGGGLCGGYTPSGWNRIMSLYGCGDCDCCSKRCRYCFDYNLNCSDHCKSRGERMLVPSNLSEQLSLKRSPHHRPSCCLLGEIAYELQRRIVDNILGQEKDSGDYSVNDVKILIEKEMVPGSEMHSRYMEITAGLQDCGYDDKFHIQFSKDIIAKYGLFPCNDKQDIFQSTGLDNAESITCLLPSLAETESERKNMNILIKSLEYLSKYDGCPLFDW